MSGRLVASRVGLLLYVGYLALGLVFWHELLPNFASVALVGGTGDAGLFISWLEWAAHAVTHGLNPL